MRIPSVFKAPETTVPYFPLLSFSSEKPATVLHTVRILGRVTLNALNLLSTLNVQLLTGELLFFLLFKVIN